MAKEMKIELGVGVGPVKYGMTEEEVISIFGHPDKIEEKEYVDDDGDWYRELIYLERAISFTFNKNDDYKLGTIDVSGPGYTLFGKDLFNLPIEQVKKFVVKSTNVIPKYEDQTWGSDSTLECLDQFDLGLMLFLRNGCLSEIQCGYLFESDNETVIWPHQP